MAEDESVRASLKMSRLRKAPERKPSQPVDEISKLAIADAKDRLKAQLDLVYAIDRQAMTFFGYSSTVSLAAATGTASLASGWLLRSEAVSTSTQIAILGLALVAAGFFAAASLCLHVMRSWKVALPGREPEFWLWALEEPVPTLAELAVEYLDQMKEASLILKTGSETMSSGLETARGLALASGLVGAAVWTVAALART